MLILKRKKKSRYTLADREATHAFRQLNIWMKIGFSEEMREVRE